jgi:16S rRNA C967 or C1407 C5-methylase (RsmB/RsmF family)/NOL1/NOP2/fmu family ribosome biogenesis protein
MLPSDFTEQMRRLPDFDFAAFEMALQTPASVSIRLNTAKKNTDSLPPDWLRAPVPWHPEGYYLPERPSFTLDPLLHAGAYYVQEAASMFLYEAVQQSADLTQRLRVLDLCAAPGGKSTLLASMLTPESLLVCNEVIKTRLGPLRENLERWGHPNTAIVHAEAEALGAMEDFFDLIVADAPCSGEGLFRKDPDAVREWSAAHVDFCALRQRKILASVLPALAPGGLLVFSTCTYNRRENEENVQWLLHSFDMEMVPLHIPTAWGVTEYEQGCYHFFPHRTRGEGFFISVLRKKGEKTAKFTYPTAFRSLKNLPKAQYSLAQSFLKPDAPARFFQMPAGEILALPEACEGDFLLLDKALKSKWFGVHIGEIKGRDFIPAHPLALSLWAHPDLPGTDLPLEQALTFLRKEPPVLPDHTPTGWTLARYKGYPLGWMKVLPNRVNNYLPGERRILSRNF